MAFEASFASPPKGVIALGSPKPTSLLSYCEVDGSPRAKLDPKKDLVDASLDHQSNPFDDHHSLPPPPFTSEERTGLDTRLDNAHSHHFTTAYITETEHEAPQQQTQSSSAAAAANTEVALAAENLALALEAAANQQENPCARKALLRRVEKIRKKGNKVAKSGTERKYKVLKNTGCGLVLLFTTPVYIAGAIVEGTGTMLKSSGIIVKGLGTGLKKVHTITVDKLNITI